MTKLQEARGDIIIVEWKSLAEFDALPIETARIHVVLIFLSPYPPDLQNKRRHCLFETGNLTIFNSVLSQPMPKCVP
jgi:hypothetical protein